MDAAPTPEEKPAMKLGHSAMPGPAPLLRVFNVRPFEKGIIQQPSKVGA